LARRARSFALERAVYVDESGLAPGLGAGYGYALRGQRCTESTPLRVCLARGLVNLIGVLSASRVEAMSYPVRVKASVFERFVGEHLVSRLEVGLIVVWDNASIHSAAACEPVEQTGGASAALQPGPSAGVGWTLESSGGGRGWSVGYVSAEWARRQCCWKQRRRGRIGGAQRIGGHGFESHSIRKLND